MRIDYELDKKVNKYRTKLCFLFLLTFLVGATTLYFLLFSDFSHQL